ncbi:adenylate/guanylate cyclase domain-containing protein [Mesorhizobium sp. IMUNJ 23232]|uniref:adenylate/guanylate cyclase domain-containing protein n=1 Tax=Mesorhizobium sp. IMUNJ 23232 TaxID=3376064 RepID=UPI0037A07687
MRSLSDQTASALLAKADTTTERIASAVRVIAGVVLLVGLRSAAYRNPEHLDTLGPLLANATLMTGIVVASGFVTLLFLRFSIWRPWMAYLAALVDAALVATLLYFTSWVSLLPADFAFAFPIVTAIPLFLAVNMLRFRPAVQVCASLLFAAGAAVAILAAHPGDGSFHQASETLDMLFSLPPNIMRLVMLALTACVFILAAARGRRMLLNAVEETANRVNLSRFVPTELAPLMAASTAGALRTGRKAEVALMFVDMRDSTALEENAAPDELVNIISDYRALILDAAANHGGVVDKFIGDGAFLVFGVPEARPDDAARAVRCAEAILASIRAWNDARALNGDQPIRVGIGIHAGEAFVGIVGAAARLEFAVLGDAVNVASRVESETKVLKEPLLISAHALRLANEPASKWRSLGPRYLRGRSEPVELFAEGAGRVEGRIPDRVEAAS